MNMTFSAASHLRHGSTEAQRRRQVRPSVAPKADARSPQGTGLNSC